MGFYCIYYVIQSRSKIASTHNFYEFHVRKSFIYYFIFAHIFEHSGLYVIIQQKLSFETPPENSLRPPSLLLLLLTWLYSSVTYLPTHSTKTWLWSDNLFQTQIHPRTETNSNSAASIYCSRKVFGKANHWRLKCDWQS